MIRRTTIIAVALMATCACGKAAIPTERLGRAEGAVQSARETGAESEPTAALHLRLARENIQRAKELMARDENERAAYLLMRAEADANLAHTLRDEANARRVAEQAVAQMNAAKSSPMQEGR